jgi:hypothetical protein
MFERFKRKNPEHKKPNVEALVTPIGAAAIAADAAELTPAVEQERSSENLQKVTDIMNEAGRRYTEFAKEAEAKGLDRPTIKGAMLAAIEAGKLPALARGGGSFRGSGQEIDILHGGPIPDNLVHISLDPTDSIIKEDPNFPRSPNAREIDNSIRDVHISVRPHWQTRRVEVPDSLHIEKFHLSQQNDSDLDPAYGSWLEVIGKLKAALNDEPTTPSTVNPPEHEA